jgi:hypothetical protein
MTISVTAIATCNAVDPTIVHRFVVETDVTWDATRFSSNINTSESASRFRGASARRCVHILIDPCEFQFVPAEEKAAQEGR